MIRFACPGCSATFTVGDEKAGKTGKCPKCQSQFVIPAADAGAPAADVPPPVPPPTKAPSRPTLPPLPPPATDPNAPVEIAPCPKCDTRLSVLPTDVGVDIQCPSCETVFKALRADAPPPPDAGAKGKGKGSSALVKLGSGSKKDDDDDDDRPSTKKKSRRGDDDDDDDRPSKRRSSRRGDDDDDDDDDRPSRRRRSRRGGGWSQPHRGVMLLVFALLGWVVCLIFAIVAWVMASNDLKEIEAGRMDPEGQGLTQAAKVVSMIACIVALVGVVLYCGFAMLAIVAGAAR